MNQIKDFLRKDKKGILNNCSTTHILYLILTRNPVWLRYKYVKYMRYANYYRDEIKKRKVRKHYAGFIYYSVRKNMLGTKLGLEIESANIGGGLSIYHNGNVIVNENSVIGENCKFHGDNCVGNDGTNDLCPILGNNVDIGVGAKIIGNIKIADNVKIGANAVIVKDIIESGSVWGGIPGRKLH